MRISLLLSLLVIVGCGGGGGGGDPAYDLNGWWAYSYRDNGTEDPYQLAVILPAEHSGSTVVFNQYSHTLEGDTLRCVTPGPSDPDRIERTIEVLSNDLLEGVHVRYSGGTQVNWLDVRMVRVAVPTGTFTMDGTVGTTGVSIDSSTAYAHESTDSASPTFTVLVYDNRIDGANVLAFQWPNLPPIAEATYTVAADLSLALVNPSGMSSAHASAGSVDIQSITASRMIGTYTYDLVGGGTVSGAFDVDILSRFP